MMVLYSGTPCPFSQRCRLVLFEKGMDFEVRDVDLFNKPEDISTMNPYGQVPILVESDLMLFNFEKELFVHVHVLENDKAKNTEKIHEKARAEIRDRLTTLAPLFLKN